MVLFQPAFCAPFHGGLRWHCEGLCIYQHLDLCTEAPANCGRSESGAGMGWGLAALAALARRCRIPKIYQQTNITKHYQTLPQTQNSQLKFYINLNMFEYVEICRNSKIMCWAQQLLVPKGPMKSPNELLWDWISSQCFKLRMTYSMVKCHLKGTTSYDTPFRNGRGS